MTAKQAFEITKPAIEGLEQVAREKIDSEIGRIMEIIDSHIQTDCKNGYFCALLKFADFTEIFPEITSDFNLWFALKTRVAESLMEAGFKLDSEGWDRILISWKDYD